MSNLNDVLATIEGRKHQALTLLKEFLAIPSVSAKPDHASEVRRCANWVADQCKAAALETSVMETGGHPAVVAKNKHVPGRPTILLYGHYDVQPPEPLELWKSPPFEPTVRKDDHGHEAIFARGAADDKGQVLLHLEAITAWQAHGGVPVNLTLLIEGEEEVGSDNLYAFVDKYAEDLRADLCVISDTGMLDRHTPSITSGLRGLVYEEIILTGPNHDLHSGSYGGAVPNVANILCQIIAAFHDTQGRVTIPGFYDDVQPITKEEKKQMDQLPFDEAHWLADLKIPFSSGEANFSILERTSTRPTLDVNGLTAGYQGEGAKTVIASIASAKVSMRLVPVQDPTNVRQNFEAFVRARVPGNVKLELRNFGEATAVITPIDSAAAKIGALALEQVFAKPPVFIRGGGTIPVVSAFKQYLGIDTLMIGFGLPDDRVHSPNEKFDLMCFHKGTQTAAVLYDKLAKFPLRAR